jgi:hypothetical protein
MDWIFGLIAVVAFLVGCVFGYDIGHMKGCEKFLKDIEGIEKDFNRIKDEQPEIITLRAQRFTKYGEHADASELVRKTREEVLRQATEHIEDYTSQTASGYGFMAELKIAKRR